MMDRNASVNPGGLAALKNVARFLTLVETLVHRDPHLPGMGVFSGYSGYGKTYSALYAWNKRDALRVEVGDSWTRKKFLEKVLAEADVKTNARTIADLTEEVIKVLGDDVRRPLFIDEADKLADKNMLELVREIQEHSQVPVLLIGEEKLPSKLMKVERVHNRVLEWVLAQPSDLDDARALAALFCPNLTLSDCLLDETVNQAKGVARRIVVNLTRMREHGRNTGENRFVSGDFEPGWFYTSEPPRRHARRAA